jgi:hypothetical protein
MVSALHPSRPPGGRSSLAGIGVVSIVVFWTGLRVMLAAGGPPWPWTPAPAMAACPAPHRRPASRHADHREYGLAGFHG